MPPKSQPKQESKTNIKQDPVELERTNMLLNSGLLEGYEFILKSLCKAGLPEGNIFDYASTKLLQFETKWKGEVKRREKLMKYKQGEVTDNMTDKKPATKAGAYGRAATRRIRAGKDADKDKAGTKIADASDDDLAKGQLPESKTKVKPKK